MLVLRSCGAPLSRYPERALSPLLAEEKRQGSHRQQLRPSLNNSTRQGTSSQPSARMEAEALCGGGISEH